MQSNPRSLCKMHYDRPSLLVEHIFLRMFISFKAQKDGSLAGCRPFIDFDGCFLKGPFGGVLLVIVALDGNNSLFPLAFAVAECENKETWSWFFYFFEQYFGPFDNHLLFTLISDRQKGLNLAYEEILPNADGRYYCRHIYSNFKLSFPGLLLRNYFCQVAKSYDETGYNQAMERNKDINIETWRYLMKIPKIAWARHSFGEAVKCDHVTNNFTESFNACVGEFRDKPMLTLVDGLRRKFMNKLHKRFQKSCTWTSSLTPQFVEKLKLIGEQSRTCELMMTSENLFEVLEVDKYIVNLSDRTCECGAFQISGIPCKHAALCIIYRREKLENYCDMAFTKKCYQKTYAVMINPIPHESRWPSMSDATPSTLLPPPLRRAPDRPRKNMRRKANERAPSSEIKRSTILKCSNCQSFGHNKRTCQSGPTKAKRDSTSTNQMANRRGKPGRGMASAGSCYWKCSYDFFQSRQQYTYCCSQEKTTTWRNQNPSTTANVQLNAQARTGGIKKKRGRPANSSGTNKVNMPERMTANPPAAAAATTTTTAAITTFES